MSSPKLVLIRGLPGSGKTTKAKQLSRALQARHFEADMYFENDQGEYVFDPAKLTEAHEWCFQQTKYWLEQGVPVVVSNTFVQRWEMDRYLDYCREHHIAVEVLVCRGEYESLHGVPPATINKMRRLWQE
ncbi:ATP-binding protein [Vibrio sp. CAU 1672]|uniref:AAA family ATPase n=1 Tax=Vibrio sp. CAU 1672 TaxID=3032594 RepID=UPI0023DCAF06|nr:ATP-binding protein [Vibrio sp. CAU 1672]MDF2152229.1 ATP-binding protein [Vibrio sp. CAU 1672]